MYLIQCLRIEKCCSGGECVCRASRVMEYEICLREISKIANIAYKGLRVHILLVIEGRGCGSGVKVWVVG